MDPFTALFFLVSSFAIVTIATLAYVASGYRPEMRFTLVASLLLIAALFAFSPLMFIARNPEARAAFEKKAKAWAEAQQRQPFDP
jgi:RsiW-degrading membrane proteinase PrsW (M82 family)